MAFPVSPRNIHTHKPCKAEDSRNVTLVAERSHNKYGSTSLISNTLKVKNVSVRPVGIVELITVVMPAVAVQAVYKPPNEPFTLPALGYINMPHIVITRLQQPQ